MNNHFFTNLQQYIDSLLKDFPIKVNSLDHFVEILTKKKATYVEGKPYVVRDPIDEWNKQVTLTNHDYTETYSAVFSSENPSGRPIVFEEVYKIKYASKYESEGIKEEIYLKLIVTIDDRLKIIKSMLPNLKTTIFDTKVQLNEYTYNQILSDAEKLGALPWEPSKDQTIL